MADTNKDVNNDGNDSDDEYFEAPADIIKEFGTHPLMQRGQAALFAQLKDTQDKLQVEFLEREEEYKRVAANREILGVQLYNLQQQLARIQISLENAHGEYNSLVDKRLSEETLSKQISANNTEQQHLCQEYTKTQKKYSQELDSLNETIQQIQKYNEEVRSEIALTRRATYKAEQSTQHLEKHKQTQDALVDHLNKQIRAQAQQIEVYKQQLAHQCDETADANEFLTQTQRELDTINAEKKQLIVQWKSALSALSRRDEALVLASDTLTAAESAVHDHDVEIETTKRELLHQQRTHESLVNLRDRLEHELVWVEENLNKMKIEREQLNERYSLLSKSLTQTDVEQKKLEHTHKQIVHETESLLQSLQIVTLERQKMSEEVSLVHSTQANISKAVQNLLRDQATMKSRIHAQENEANEVENTIARTHVDHLTVCSVLDTLKEGMKSAEKELKDKDATIAKYQLEIRQRNDEIEKKMYRVDRLNKKYEKMVESAGGEENLGPLENTIKNLSKETDSITQENKELEREWLLKQTSMVQLLTHTQQLTDTNNEYRARVTILSQQQLRQTHTDSTLKEDIRQARTQNTDIQRDMTKLNSLISENHDHENRLQSANFLLETECVEELREMESVCVSTETEIADAKTNKQSLLSEILEMERQALLWEKKIQLDKETREALDPSVGQAESNNMEHEIHRMELRHTALLREQERLSTEIERAIQKRGTIATRFKGKETAAAAGASTSKSSTGGGGAELTQANVKKRIGTLKREARLLAEDTTQINVRIEDQKQHLQQMTLDLESTTMKYNECEEQTRALQGEINDLLYQKQVFAERISYRTKYFKRLKELASKGGDGGIDMQQSLQIERRLLSATQALENVKTIIADLTDAHPHLAEVLTRVGAMTEPGIDAIFLEAQ